MLTNYVYKLRPNVSQSEKMDNWVEMLRSHYNWCLNDRIAQYNQQFIQGDYCDIRTASEACPITCFVSKNGATGEPWKDNKLDKGGNLKNPRRSAGDIQITSLPMLKQARPWYADIDSTVLQQNVKRLDVAYKNFFEGRGFPQFKNRSNFTSFTYTVGTKVQGNKIYLPKIGWMRFHNSRLIPDGFTIKAVTVRKRQDGWYISVRIEDKNVPNLVSRPLTEVEKVTIPAKSAGESTLPSELRVLALRVEEEMVTLRVIGCDLGITKLVHLSDGHQINNPKFATNKKTKHLLKVRQRRVSRKVKGSKNRKKAARKVGRFHKRISDKRLAYQWYVANKIVSRNVDAIGLEDLNVAGMLRRCKVKVDEKTGRFLKNGQSRKKGLNRSISDASWSELTSKIEYLAAKQYKVVIKVNPKNSSCECRNCGHIDKLNRDRERFICVQCGHMEHADLGASKTVRDRALSLVRQCIALVPRVEATAEPFRVRGDSAKPDADISKSGKGTSKRPKQRKEISARTPVQTC